MRQFAAFTVLVASMLAMVAAECPNACSAHGKCGAYDMCTCYRNWMANDCSERICQFGLAHVDTPKGDLDSSSGALSGPSSTVVKNDQLYPFGTTESYPAMTNIDGTVLDNTAHEYRECSNKGLCDRSTGTCACFEGYDGSACQRASCPSNADGMCSGHGTCQSISEIASADYGNLYNLWDEDATMGCVCDGGYEGADCSQRTCKYGVDPLYWDGTNTVRYSNFTFELYTIGAQTVYGNYSLVFHDSFGEDWQTGPIDSNAVCTDLEAAFEALPNNVVPANSLRCYKWASGEMNSATHDVIYDSNANVYTRFTIAFPENPGKLKQIGINIFLDGTRPTLYTTETTSTLGYHVYQNGFVGEDYDYVPDKCEGVTVTLGDGTVSDYLDGLDTQTTKALKRCLGSADGDITNNQDVYNWDVGTVANPHLIKLVENTQWEVTASTSASGDLTDDPTAPQVPRTNLCNSNKINAAKFGTGLCSNENPAGFYAVLWYDSSDTHPFRLFTRAGHDYSTTTKFNVYTTTGWLQQVNPNAAAFTENSAFSNAQRVNSHYSNLIHTTSNGTVYSSYRGNVDCETNAVGSYGALDCLNKGDKIMLINNVLTTGAYANNPVYPSIYTVEKISRENREYNSPDEPANVDREDLRNEIWLDYSVNSRHIKSAFAAEIYKFYTPARGSRSTDPTCTTAAPTGNPLPAGSYHYAAPCSNRGICNGDTGLCECFHGYTSDNCGTINALAV